MKDVWQLLLKAIIVAFENLTSIVIGAMVLLMGFGIGYCIYSHRYQEIVISHVVGMRDFEWFQGRETISYKEKIIYECYFHGGLIE